MENLHARPLTERDRSVPARCLGFGWIVFEVKNIFVFAPAVCMVRAHYAEPPNPTVSVLKLIGIDEEIVVPGSPRQVTDAIIDALGAGEPHPLHIGPRESISHMGKP